LYFVIKIKIKLKYETTQNKIKIYEKLLNTIKHGYLKVSFIL